MTIGLFSLKQESKQNVLSIIIIGTDFVPAIDGYFQFPSLILDRHVCEHDCLRKKLGISDSSDCEISVCGHLSLLLNVSLSFGS